MVLVTQRDAAKRGTGTTSEERGPSQEGGQVPTTHANGPPAEAEEVSPSPTPPRGKQVQTPEKEEEERGSEAGTHARLGKEQQVV